MWTCSASHPFKLLVCRHWSRGDDTCTHKEGLTMTSGQRWATYLFLQSDLILPLSLQLIDGRLLINDLLTNDFVLLCTEKGNDLHWGQLHSMRTSGWLSACNATIALYTNIQGSFHISTCAYTLRPILCPSKNCWRGVWIHVHSSLLSPIGSIEQVCLCVSAHVHCNVSRIHKLYEGLIQEWRSSTLTKFHSCEFFCQLFIVINQLLTLKIEVFHLDLLLVELLFKLMYSVSMLIGQHTRASLHFIQLHLNHQLFLLDISCLLSHLRKVCLHSLELLFESSPDSTHSVETNNQSCDDRHLIQ